MILRFIIPVIIANLPVIIPILAEPRKYLALKIIPVYILFLILTVSYFFFIEFKGFLKLTRKNINMLLDPWFQEIHSRINKDCLIFITIGRFNVNPFLGKNRFFKTCLFAEYPLNFPQKIGFRLIRTINTGVAGASFKENKLKIINFALAKKLESHSWGLTKEDLKLVNGYKSGIAIPLTSPKRNNPIGTLAIYSKESLRKSGFENKKLQKFMESKIVPHISVLLEAVR